MTQEAKRNFIADTKEFAELLSELSKTQKASIVMYMEHLSPGSFTEENELEIKINHRKITLREYIEKYLPDADVGEAKEIYREFGTYAKN